MSTPESRKSEANTSQPVFLIATQRSGTNYLRSLLRETGAFADFDEILHSEIDENNPAPFAYFDWAKHSYFNFRAARIAANPELSIPHKKNVISLFNDYLDYLSSHSKNCPFFLMDVKYNSLHHFDPIWQSLSGRKFIFELVKSRGCRALHLVRENLFNVYLSELVANQTGKFVITNDEDFKISNVTVDIQEMFSSIQRIEREINLVRLDLEKLPNVYELTYESITTDVGLFDSTACELSAFFATKLHFKRTPATQKIIQDPWSIVVNADEVKNALVRSDYAKFI